MLIKEIRGKKQEKRDGGFANLFRIRVASLLLLLASFLYSPVTSAQCAMCRAALETNEGGVKAEGVNDGIVYLMAFPYLLVGGLGYYIYRTRLQKKK